MGFKYLTMFISSTRYTLCMGERVKLGMTVCPNKDNVKMVTPVGRRMVEWLLKGWLAIS